VVGVGGRWVCVCGGGGWLLTLQQSCIDGDSPADAEHDLMGPEACLGANEGHVDEYLGVQQRLEGLQYMRLVIVPSERVVRLQGHFVRTLRGARHRSIASTFPPSS
jgi:hypothetical protein